MLSKDEEDRLESFLIATPAQLQRDTYHSPEYYTGGVKWLADNLKKTNDELVKVTEELYKTNREFADYVEAHE